MTSKNDDVIAFVSSQLRVSEFLLSKRIHIEILSNIFVVFCLGCCSNLVL